MPQYVVPEESIRVNEVNAAYAEARQGFGCGAAQAPAADQHDRVRGEAIDRPGVRELRDADDGRFDFHMDRPHAVAVDQPPSELAHPECAQLGIHIGLVGDQNSILCTRIDKPGNHSSEGVEVAGRPRSAKHAEVVDVDGLSRLAYPSGGAVLVTPTQGGEGPRDIDSNPDTVSNLYGADDEQIV